MIYVKRNQEDSSQKVVSSFLKRVKRSNLIARKRKTQFFIKPISALQRKRKAIRQADYIGNQALIERIGKK